MYFTQEDYKKIETWLKRNSVKDSTFQEALPLNGREEVVIIQEGHNRKLNITSLINQLLILSRVEDFINITDVYSAFNTTLEQAISLIPEEKRKEGQVITFLNAGGNWEIYQFKGKLNQWNILSFWEEGVKTNNIADICYSDNRPSLGVGDRGASTFDLTINKPIWWTGSCWVDANGVTV